MLFCMNSTRLVLGRHSSVGQSYMLTTNVHGRAALFANEAVAVAAMQEFQRLDLEGLTHSIAYVVMPDHVHWLMQLRAASLDVVMRRFKSRTAVHANRVLGKGGALLAVLLSRSCDPL